MIDQYFHFSFEFPQFILLSHHLQVAAPCDDLKLWEVLLQQVDVRVVDPEYFYWIGRIDLDNEFLQVV